MKVGETKAKIKIGLSIQNVAELDHDKIVHKIGTCLCSRLAWSQVHWCPGNLKQADPRDRQYQEHVAAQGKSLNGQRTISNYHAKRAHSHCLLCETSIFGHDQASVLFNHRAQGNVALD